MWIGFPGGTTHAFRGFGLAGLLGRTFNCMLRVALPNQALDQ